MTDIDIDFANRTEALHDLRYAAAVERDRRRHISGVYFQNIPCDPLDGMAVWDYREAEQKGYLKIDFLHNSIYNAIRDEQHLIALLNTEPPWDCFDDRTIVSQLAHLKNHFDVVQSIKPRSIEDLAICLALIRPGKRYLIGRPRHAIDEEIWVPVTEYYFKKAHAISYAVTITVQLNLLIHD